MVYAGDEPVDAFPKPSVPLATLVDHADLSARVTPEGHRAQQLGERARRIQKRLSRHAGADGAARELDAGARQTLGEDQR